MRAIKFRAWDKEGEVMLYEGDYALFEGCDSIFVGVSSKGALFQERCEGVSDKTVDCDDENYVLMQFTGLLDKNGREIYEGDILGYPNPIVKEVVELGAYNNEQPYEDNVQGTGFYLKGTMGLRHLIQDRAGVVIGNIYENGELLTKDV